MGDGVAEGAELAGDELIEPETRESSDGVRCRLLLVRVRDW